MEKTKEIRIATEKAVDEFRKMEVGDVVRFPIADYNYNSLRTLPSTSLVPERVEGRSWKTRLDIDNACVDVTRVS